MSDVSLSSGISSIQRGTYKALDTSSAAAKEAAESATQRAQQTNSSDTLGKNIDVMA